MSVDEIQHMVGPITFETTHGDLQRRIAAATACTWCGSAGVHDEDCPWIAPGC